MTIEDKLLYANSKIDFQKSKILQLETELTEARRLFVREAGKTLALNAALARKVEALGIKHATK